MRSFFQFVVAVLVFSLKKLYSALESCYLIIALLHYRLKLIYFRLKDRALAARFAKQETQIRVLRDSCKKLSNGV